MSSRSYQQQSLKEAIREMLRAGGMEKRYDDLEAVRSFHEVVGAFISKKIAAAYVRDRKLVIKTTSGPLRQELMMNRMKILGLVNEKMGEVRIEELEIY